MTDDARTPEEIEREIETRRAALSSNLDDLQDRFSIDTLVRQIGEQFREHGGDMGRSIADQVKANPIPLALTGIGLAWMMLGDSRTPAPRGRATQGVGDFRGPRHAPNSSYSVGRAGDADRDVGPAWLRSTREGSPGLSSRDRREKSGARSEGIADAVGNGLSSAGSSISDAAASAGASLSDGADSMRNGIAEARDRIADGTESLTEEGRRRVIAARRKAVDMQRDATRSMSAGSDAAADFYERQPLVVGALALAVGAVLAGSLPRTRVEDDLMGEQSDALLAEAERIFEEEKSKAVNVAKAVTEEVKDIAAETKDDLDRRAPDGQTAAEALEHRTKAAVDRVTEAARTAAQDEKATKPVV